MYRSANVSAGRAGGRRWAQQHPPPAGARSADARAPPQVLLRSWSRLSRAPSYATPSRPDRTNCRKAFHWPHRPASSWYHFSWRNLHRRANADSLFGTNVEITPPSISHHFCYGTRLAARLGQMCPARTLGSPGLELMKKTTGVVSDESEDSNPLC